MPRTASRRPRRRSKPAKGSRRAEPRGLANRSSVLYSGAGRLFGPSFEKMIVELSVENLAIIERCDLTLGPGFTVLTGETGAGKSLLVDALELAFGARSSSGMVRTGAARALVQVTLDLTFDP